MAARCRAHDWAATPLGPVAGWPAALRTAVRLMLGTPIAAALWCGPATSPLQRRLPPHPRRKHPAALGRSRRRRVGRAVAAWRRSSSRCARGPPCTPGGARSWRGWRTARGRWFTYSLSALTDDAGECVAVYNVAVETTERVRAGEAAEAANAALQEQALELELPTSSCRRRRASWRCRRRRSRPPRSQLEARTAEAEAAHARAAGCSKDGRRVLRARRRVPLRGGERRAWSAQSGSRGRAPRPHVLGAVPRDGGHRRSSATTARPSSIAWRRTSATTTSDGRLDLVADADVYPAAGGGSPCSGATSPRSVRAEAALRESEARYRALFESIDAGFCVIEMLFDARRRAGGLPLRGDEPRVRAADRARGRGRPHGARARARPGGALDRDVRPRGAPPARRRASRAARTRWAAGSTCTRSASAARRTRASRCSSPTSARRAARPSASASGCSRALRGGARAAGRGLPARAELHRRAPRARAASTSS